MTIALVVAATSTPIARATDDGVWSEFTTSGFPACEQALVAVDAEHHRIYLYGPRLAAASGENNNETYVLDMGVVPPQFRRLSTVAPPAARYNAALAFDPLRRRLLLFGGASQEVVMTETEVWELSLADPPRWRRLEPLGPLPPARTSPVAVYDSRRDRVLLFGGAHGAPGVNGSAVSETWALDLSAAPTWSLLTTAGAEPPALAGAAGVYDSRRDRLLIYGGGTNRDFRDPQYDLWRLSLSGTPTWSLEPTLGPPPVSEPEGTYGAAYDSTADRLFIVPSVRPASTTPSALSVSSIDLSAGLSWEQLASTGADPGLRYLSAVALLGRQLVCIGGRGNSDFFSDAHALDVDARVWSDVSPVGITPPRNMDPATAAMDSAGARVFVWAGTVPQLWTLMLDPIAVWQRPIVTGPAPTLPGAPLVWDPVGGRLLLVDGTADPTVQVWAFDAGPVPHWNVLPATGAGPPAQTAVSVTIDAKRNRLLVFEGSFGTPQLSGLWELRLDPTPTWHALPSLPATGFLATLGCDETLDRLVVAGGYAQNGVNQVWQNTTWVRPLDDDAQPWTLTSATGQSPVGPGVFFHDAARNRLLHAGQNAGDIRSLALASGSEYVWAQLHPSTRPNVQIYGPAVLDGARDRLLLALRSYLNGSVLLFGGGAPPGLLCPAEGGWSPASIREVSFGLSDRAGLSLSYEYTLECARDWPGFPIRGLASPSGFSTDYVPIGIAIPDTAAFGSVQFHLSVSAREQAGLDASCSFQLLGEAVPIVSLGADAQPDRVVVRWQTTRPGLTVTVARRSENGPWIAMARQALASPGIVSYEDQVIQTDQRYYYRAQISDVSSAGAYGQIRVDVPQWTLDFAADQQNPIRGRFAIDALVPAPGPTDLDVFDVTGRRAFRASRTAGGPGRLSFDLGSGGSPSPGVYFVRLTQGSRTRQRTVVFLR